MKRVFRNERAPDKVLDVISHTKEMIKEHPDLKVYVGTDSQNKRRYTHYAVCVCYRYGHRGVHVIYNRWKEKKIKDKFKRLWREAEVTIEVAEHITANNLKVDYLDFDFNDDEAFFSSKLVQATTGWARGLGYKCNTKPETLVACRAADHLCR
jgi:uncharacterized protein